MHSGELLSSACCIACKRLNQHTHPRQLALCSRQLRVQRCKVGRPREQRLLSLCSRNYNAHFPRTHPRQLALCRRQLRVQGRKVGRPREQLLLTRRLAVVSDHERAGGV